VAGQKTETPVPPDRPDNLDHPVGPLHRTRGSFSAEASTHAALLPAPLARLAVVSAGALLFAGLGMLVGARLGARRAGDSRIAMP
jgi:hypothetical protein